MKNNNLLGKPLNPDITKQSSKDRVKKPIWYVCSSAMRESLTFKLLYSLEHSLWNPLSQQNNARDLCTIELRNIVTFRSIEI